MPVPKIFDERVCSLGEGALWHPERQQIFWFDIARRKLLTRCGAESQEWCFQDQVSAAGWVDENKLLIASETELFTYSLDAEKKETVCLLEANNPLTRSNDGRADPWGGFWISTMGKRAQSKAGTIYRYYKGELRELYEHFTIPNAICFSPDRRFGYFADMAAGLIWRQPLSEKHGWPLGTPEVFIDCNPTHVRPDGAVVDSLGRIWNAQWGSSRVACYERSGKFLNAITLPASQTTCPAFGGAELKTLFITTAIEELSDDDRTTQSDAGKIFTIDMDIQGQAEYQVFL